MQIITVAIALGICLHAGNHLACDFPRLIASGPTEYRLVARYFGREKPTYRALLARAEGVTGIVMVTLMAVSFTLATRPFRNRQEIVATNKGGSRRRCFSLGHLAGFNAFWYSHHLLIVVYLSSSMGGSCSSSTGGSFSSPFAFSFRLICWCRLLALGVC
ncbi:unnamed protein product [Urochloa humidicola]